jgi:hypothetical protein
MFDLSYSFLRKINLKTAKSLYRHNPDSSINLVKMVARQIFYVQVQFKSLTYFCINTTK